MRSSFSTFCPPSSPASDQSDTESRTGKHDDERPLRRSPTLSAQLSPFTGMPAARKKGAPGATANTAPTEDVRFQNPVNVVNQAKLDFERGLADLHLDPALSLPEALQARCSWTDAVSPTLDAYRIGKQAVLLWRTGPQAGKAYDIVRLPEQAGPDVANILEDIRKNLHALDQHSSSLIKHREALVKLLTDMFGAYLGSMSQPGWRHFRLINPELNKLLRDIDDVGFEPWLREQAKIAGCHFKLSDDRNIDSYLDSLFFSETDDMSALDDMGLEHGSHGVTIDSVLNASGLISNERRQQIGLEKLAGASKRDDVVRKDSNVVSFWDHRQRSVKFLSPGYGGLPGGFDYPLSYTVASASVSQLNVRRGHGRHEKTLDNLPINCLDKIFVPECMVADVQRVFHQHGHVQVQVEPLIREGEYLV